jgi:SWI/SNF-related matrix-associated actin-dependent regulator 1 of chromatin subfamily A
MTLARANPYPYQREGVRAIEGFGGRALLADDMGLGKTLQVLHAVRRNPTYLPAVVACPASVKYHWEREAACQIGMAATVLEGTTPTKHALQGLIQHRLIILNYDIIKAWLPYLLALHPQLVVIDECQNIANPRAQRTKALRILCKGVPHVIGTSGTPLENRPKELLPILSIIAPQEFGSGQDFLMRYCAPRRAPWGWTYDGAVRLPELHKRLKRSCMIRRLKEDVLHELPQKVRRVIPVPLRNREEYDEARSDFLGWVRRTGGAEAAIRAARAEKLAQIGHLRMLAGRGKIRAVADWIDNYLARETAAEVDKKLVVFGVHTKMLEALHRRYAHIGVMVNGAVTGRARDQAIQTFINIPECRLFIGNIRACGTGIDGLQRVCRCGVFVEMDWKPATHIQAEDRLLRIGQAWPVWWYYLIAGDTIEEKMCEITQAKHGVLRAVLNGEAETAGFDILDMLIEYLAQGGV